MTTTALGPDGELDRFVAGLAAKDEFSGSLLLTCRGRPVLVRSYGMADRARSVRNGPDTAFALASVTKLATAVAIAQLAQRNKLAYTDPLAAYLDGFPAGVTVHHLLTHTAGFGDYHQEPGYVAAAAGWTSAAEVMDGITAFIRRSAPLFPPGAGYSYSNSGYHLLGMIVAKVSGLAYHDYVRRNVFAAAGMRGSGFFTKPQWRTAPRIAHPYRRDPATGQWTDTVEEFEFIGTPAGEAFATSADLERFARALWQHGFLDRGHTELTLSGKLELPRQQPPPGSPPLPPPTGTPPQAVFQCYGPIGTLLGGHWSFAHGGGNSAGVSTSVELHPALGWVAVFLSNYAGQAVLQISDLARRLITTEGQR
ncbi:serine hydrolase domain-containing protein [Amycolatopsis sp. NPDC049252]|uniref:serine hydrolase domain-containing protein n=1 Tax=Amycolatopsis sp. NPDC049252 TaxID=3363933 RepID=UPI00371FDFDB